VIGKRVGYGRESMAPHSLTMTMIGASLLWVGWFGFNAGSALEAGDIAALAFINTCWPPLAPPSSWVLGEWITKGKPSMLGAASGAVAGLVAITPACGFVGPMGALVIGLLGGIICLWGVNGLKRLLRRRRFARRVRRARRRRHPRRAADRRVRFAFAGRQGIWDYVTNKASADPYSIGHQVWVQGRRSAPPSSGRRWCLRRLQSWSTW
jgi:Amt family ammonium transporter